MIKITLGTSFQKEPECIIMFLNDVPTLIFIIPLCLSLCLCVSVVKKRHLEVAIPFPILYFEF